MRPTRPFHFRLLLAAGPLLPLLGLLASLSPDPLRPGCLTHQLTGYPCPACGSFRALCHFSAGHLSQAFLVQPLMTLLYGGVLLASAAAWVLWLLKKPHPPAPAISPRAWKWLIAGLAAAVLLNWAYLVAAGV